jgi:hypothetical protein
LLKVILPKVSQRAGEDARLQRQLVSQAMSAFKNDVTYQAYLDKLQALGRLTDNSAQQKRLEDELRKAQEAQQREQASRAKEQQRAQREAAERKKVEAELQEARRLAEEAQQRADEEQYTAAATPKNGWRQLLGEIGKYVADNLAKPPQTAQSSPAYLSHLDNRLPAHAPVNLSGLWQSPQDPQRIMYSIVHRGHEFVSQGKNWLGVVVVEGRGTVSGNKAQSTYMYLAGYGQVGYAQAEFEISPDGWRMDGVVADSVGGITYVTLLRQS